MLCSASGLVFAAFAPAGQTAAAIAAELKERPRRHGFRSQAALEAGLDAIRGQGWAAIYSAWVAGIDAVAVPVFDYRGRIEAVLLTIGRDRPQLGRTAPDDDAMKPVVAALLQAGQTLSTKLGYKPAIR